MIQLHRRSRVYGVGINDADYVVQVGTTIKDQSTGKPKTIVKWMCPYFTTWKNMLRRCYSKNKFENLTYEDKIVCDEWLRFSNFKRWMEQQDWEGLSLDKDILCHGNKVYTPQVCRFVPSFVNNILLTRASKRGELPLGVSKNRRKFGAYSSDANGKTVLLGLFNNPESAHRAWQMDKAVKIENVIKDYAAMGCFKTEIAEALSLRVWRIRISEFKGEETYEI